MAEKMGAVSGNTAMAGQYVTPSAPLTTQFKPDFRHATNTFFSPMTGFTSGAPGGTVASPQSMAPMPDGAHSLYSPPTAQIQPKPRALTTSQPTATMPNVGDQTSNIGVGIPWRESFEMAMIGNPATTVSPSPPPTETANSTLTTPSPAPGLPNDDDETAWSALRRAQEMFELERYQIAFLNVKKDRFTSIL